MRARGFHAVLVAALAAAAAGPASAQVSSSVADRERRDRWGTYRPDMPATLGRHTDSPLNWNPDQERFVGKETEVLECVGPDPWGFHGVRVKADGGLYFWRVHDLAGGIMARDHLPAMKIPGTEIPRVVIPVAEGVPLRRGPSAADPVVGSVPLYSNVSPRGVFYIPRHLYVYTQQVDYVAVMESDDESRKTLGWLPTASTLEWPTRQGYVINCGRAAREPLKGYASIEDGCNARTPVYTEDMGRTITPDPNATRMAEGLLVERKRVAGREWIQCAMIPPGEKGRKPVWVPYNRTRPEFITYVLMTDLDVVRFQSVLHGLVSALGEEGEEIETYRTALEEAWDQTARGHVGRISRVEKRAVNYASFYRRVQDIYPDLGFLLALPPGDLTKASRIDLAQRFENSLNTLMRHQDRMTAEGRKWMWVRVSEL